MGKKIIVYAGYVIAVCSLVLWSSCQKKGEDEKSFARVGWKVISQENFDSFKKMKRLYPSSMYGKLYPGKRSNASQCVETQALFGKAKSAVGSKIKSNIDWQWKDRFYTAQMYLFEILDKNLGFPEKTVEKYYSDNKEDYKKVIQVTVGTDSTAADSTAADSTKKAETKDSVIYRPMNAVRAEIVRALFVEKFPPTEEHYKSLANTSTTDSTKVEIDSAMAKEQWVQKKKRNIPEFFMKEFYQGRFDKEYPDSLDEVFGEGKLITEKDLDMIMQWLPAQSRADYKTPEKKRYLVEWLLKWKFFHEEAQKSGFADTKDVEQVNEWAWKFEVVERYINEKVSDDVEKEMVIDTSMCLYENWDRTGRPDNYPDSASLANIITSNISSKKQVAIDKLIFGVRKKAGIKFLQSDFVDELVNDPEKMAAEADSLYGAGNSKDAEKLYKKLVDNFPFDDKGLSSLVELAKILTEKEKYIDAIKNYRRYLLFSSDVEKRCNIFFMVGFVYGEYLSKPELAEASYKCILKNTPDC